MSVYTGLVLTPIEAMRLAIAEGEKGWGSVAPNPLVGCVITDREGRLLSAGYHAMYGGPHAEVDALSRVDSRTLEGAIVYVTLEPCAHEGKTGSCAKALAKLPLGKVVYGLVDPNPQVSGQGAKILETAGIRTQLMREIDPSFDVELERIAEHFLWNQRARRPFVALKAATTLDGMMASRTGESKWISNETSRLETHRLRAGFDAVLVGKNTFVTDNPSLDVRLPLVGAGAGAAAAKKNKVIVLDRKGQGLSSLATSNLMKARPADHIYWVVENPAAHADLANKLGIQLVQGPMTVALDWLYKNGISSIFVEGGSAVHSYFIEEKLAQRLYLFIAPQLAGNLGEHWTSGLAAPSWEKRTRLRDVKIRASDGDIYWTGRFE